MINTEKVFSLEKAQEIILADRKPEGMEPVVYCLRAVDAVIYPVVFGFIFVYDGDKDKIILFQDVIDWKRGFCSSTLFQKGYNVVDDLPKGISIIPFDTIDME